jgi:hypothetical protein
MAHTVETERLSQEQIDEANERLAKIPSTHNPASPPAAAGTPEKKRKSNREPGTKGVMLQLNEEQYGELEAKAKADRRPVANYIAICVEDNFQAFITLN